MAGIIDYVVNAFDVAESAADSENINETDSSLIQNLFITNTLL